MNVSLKLSKCAPRTLLTIIVCVALSSCGTAEPVSVPSAHSDTSAHLPAIASPTVPVVLEYPCAHNPAVICPPGKGAHPDAELREEAEQAKQNPTVPAPTSLLVTPVPPGYIPPSAHRIYDVNPDEAADGPIHLRGGNSAWHIGAIPSRDMYEYCDVYVLARRARTQSTPTNLVEGLRGRYATLATGISCNAMSQELSRIYNRIWEAPRDVGAITITNVTDVTLDQGTLTGTIAFSTSSGQHGTFDLATETWTFNP